MQIITSIGKESTFTFGYMEDPSDPDIKCFSLVLIEVCWSSKTRRKIIGMGIPYVFAIGIVI